MLSYNDIIAKLKGAQPDNSVADAAGIAAQPDAPDPIAQAAQLAEAPASGPGMTSASMSGALGPDNVQPGVQTPPLGAPTPSPLAPTSAATAPAPAAGMLSPDVSNAGVSSVPSFTAPVNPATPIHHGILSRLGAGITRAVSPISSATDSELSPTDRRQAESAALLALGNGLLNPGHDSRGFKQSFLGSAVSGIQAAQGASQASATQSVGKAREAAQYAAGIAQTGRINEARAKVGELFKPLAIDAWDHDAMVNRLEQGVTSLVASGDDKGAAVLANTIKNIRDAQARGQSVNQFLQDASGIFLGNKETGDLTMIHKNTVTPVKLDQAAQRIAQSKLNSDRGMTKHYDNETQKVIGRFITDTQDLRKENGAYNQFAAIAKESAAGNPEAYKSAIINFMGALDPKAQVRSKMLEFAQQVDPTIAGRWDTLISKISDGTFPVYQLNGMIKVAQATHENTKREYMAKRNDYVDRNPGLDLETALPSEDAEFHDATYGTGPAPRAAAPLPAPAAKKTVAPSLKAIFQQ